MPDITTPLAPMVEPLSTSPQTPTVEPKESAATPQAPPPDESEAGAAESPLPDELIQIPAIQAVLAGNPPAVSMKIKGAEDRDEIKLLAENKSALMQSGMNFYRSLSGQVGVMFNALKIHPDDLLAADKQGILTAVAPDFDQLNAEVSKSGQRHPLLQANLPAAQFASPTGGARVPQAASGEISQAAATQVPPSPASVARRMAAQRVLNLKPGAPTSGPVPGAGRVLNQALTPAI